MLLEFSVENFRCYKDKITFNFSQNNITAIFGSNASGKTNMLKALSRMVRMIRESSTIKSKPLLFEPNDKDNVVSASIKFSDSNNNVFLYELSVNNTSIVNEKYTALKFKDKENWEIFSRNNKKISIHNVLNNNMESLIKRMLLNNNTLFSILLTTKIALHEAIKLLDEITKQIKIIINEDLSDFKEDDLLSHIRKDNGNKKEILKLATLADPTITNLSIKNKKTIVCSHGDTEISFKEESSGTRKTIYMTSMFIHSKKESSIILIDEIDTHFHPLVLSSWIEKINQTNNQIIFVGHNPLVVDFLIGWKVMKDISSIIYLYKDEQGIINKKEGRELYIDLDDKDKRFSELIYHNWMSYFAEDLVY